MLTVKHVSIDSELTQIVEDINNASWDDANDVCDYDVASLEAYLKKEDTIFLVCYDEAETKTFLGMASGRLELKPYDQERWLYVDEVDVCVNQRRKGAGAAIMRKMLEIAQREDCEELWLGTEIDNIPANSLYKSLTPNAVDAFVGYTFELDR